MTDFERVTSEGAEIDAYRLAVPSGWIYLTPKGPLFVPAPPPLPQWPHPYPPEVPTRQPICGCPVGTCKATSIIGMDCPNGFSFANSAQSSDNHRHNI